MSIPGWSDSSQDAGDDETGQATMSPVWQDQQTPRPHLEVRKGQALARIWHRFNGPDPSDDQQPESSARPTRQPCADHGGGVRLLIEEMQNDPELGDALRASLAASIRRVAKDYVQRPLRNPDLKASQQQLFGTDHYDEAPNQAPRSRQMKQAVLSLRARHADLVSSLQEIEDIIRSLQLSQLKVAVVFDVTSPDTPATRDAFIRNLVGDFDSLERLRKVTREISRNAERFREETREFSGRAELSDEVPRIAEQLRDATRQLSHSTEKLRNQAQRIVEDRLASDREESNGGVFLSIGEMLDLGPRLKYSEFDPSLQTAFGSAGDLLTRSLLGVWQSSEAPQDISSSV